VRYKLFKKSILHRLAIALVLAVCLVPTGQAPVSAQSIDDYFTIDYTVSFSQDVIYNNNPFSATVTGTATCIQDLPLTITEAIITGCIVAQHEDSGTWVTLNPSYTTTINPFPTKEGDTTHDSQTVELSFPVNSQPGNYQVFGELTEARVKAVLWFNVTSYLPRYQSMGSIAYLPGSDYEDEEEETTEPESPGTTDLSDYIDWRGVIINTIFARSADYICTVKLYQGTKARDIENNPLKEITIVKAEDPPPPPDACIIRAYDITPKGATFEPSAIISILYDGFQIPAGVNEDDLVIASWDEAIGEWVDLEDINVNPSVHTITAPIYHLSIFAVMAHTSPPSFTVSGLIISPTEAEIGASITTTVLVTNIGDLSGDYELIFKLDNNVEEIRNVTLSGESSKDESFTTTVNTIGTHQVDINGLSGSFVVTAGAAPPPTTVIPDETSPDKGVILPTDTSEHTITPEVPDAIDDTSETDTVIAPGIATIVYELPEIEEPLTIGIDQPVESPSKTESVLSANRWLLTAVYTLYLVLFTGIIYLFWRRRASPPVKKQKDKPNLPPPSYTVHF